MNSLASLKLTPGLKGDTVQQYGVNSANRSLKLDKITTEIVFASIWRLRLHRLTLKDAREFTGVVIHFHLKTFPHKQTLTRGTP